METCTTQSKRSGMRTADLSPTLFKELQADVTNPTIIMSLKRQSICQESIKKSTPKNTTVLKKCVRMLSFLFKTHFRFTKQVFNTAFSFSFFSPKLSNTSMQLFYKLFTMLKKKRFFKIHLDQKAVNDCQAHRQLHRHRPKSNYFKLEIINLLFIEKHPRFLQMNGEWKL